MTMRAVSARIRHRTVAALLVAIKPIMALLWLAFTWRWRIVAASVIERPHRDPVSC